ncbi:MAG: PAS domain S-box protein [Desulfuromonadaceae bacterium]|nr:PAS domain S-box protein [Desulfuromonadaceae bacterium]
MTTPGLDQEKARHEQELRIQRQIAFASGLFQGDATVRTLLESLAKGVVIIDSSGTILLVNSAAERMFGYQRNDLIGKPQTVLIPERFRKIHEEHLVPFFAEPRTMETDQLLDISGRRWEGSEFPVEISLSQVETINGVFVMALVSDITVRKEYETRLREKEEQFHIQVEGVSNYAIFMLDAEGNVLNWNAGAERLKGYRAEEIIGKHFSCFYTEEDRNAGKPEEELQKAAAEGRIAYEGWRIGKDGSRFWADVIISSLRDDNGNLRRFSKVTHDITERMRTEEALRASESKFSKAFQATPSILVIASLADGRYLEVNEAFERVMGYRRDELIGRSSLGQDIWQNPEDRATVLQMLAEGKTVRDLEIGFRSKSGGIIIGLYSADIIAIGAEQCLVSLVNDITARKKAEDELRHGEERYRRLYNETPVMLHSIDHDGRLVSVSNYWLKTLGYERDEVLGRISTEFYTEASRSYATAVVLPEFFRTGSCKEVPYQIVKKNGEIRDVLLSAIAERDSEGKVVRSLAVSIDVTDRKQAEEKIAKLNVTLAAHAADLEDANREMETFNYTVAHDLRQPLNVVGMNCQAIDLLCGDQLPEECMDYIQDAYNGVLHMNQLIEALLEFSRMGHVELHQENVSLCVLAQEVARMLKKSDPDRQVDFRIADGITADVDASLVRVVLDNLLGNAWKYTGMREKALIEFGTTEIDGNPVYFVRDNGAGFDKAAANKLFMPFQRLPGAEAFKGSGIGLATVERIIKRHGGRIWAEGEPGKGACFYFTFSAN